MFTVNDYKGNRGGGTSIQQAKDNLNKGGR